MAKQDSTRKPDQPTTKEEIGEIVDTFIQRYSFDCLEKTDIKEALEEDEVTSAEELTPQAVDAIKVDTIYELRRNLVDVFETFLEVMTVEKFRQGLKKYEAQHPAGEDLSYNGVGEINPAEAVEKELIPLLKEEMYEGLAPEVAAQAEKLAAQDDEFQRSNIFNTVTAELRTALVQLLRPESERGAMYLMRLIEPSDTIASRETVLTHVRSLLKARKLKTKEENQDEDEID